MQVGQIWANRHSVQVGKIAFFRRVRAFLCQKMRASGELWEIMGIFASCQKTTSPKFSLSTEIRQSGFGGVVWAKIKAHGGVLCHAGGGGFAHISHIC